MGFWKGLGKGLLKIAPIAAMAIPGIGPIASAAIQGGLGAANAKASGGGWKDALLGGATGAAMGGFGGGTKGLSPSKGFWGTVKDIGKQTGKQILGGGLGQQGNPYIMDDPARGGISGNMPYPGQSNYAQQRPIGPTRQPPNPMDIMEGLGPDVLMQRNQNFPNLAEALNAGRQAAYKRYPYGG